VSDTGPKASKFMKVVIIREDYHDQITQGS